MKECFKLLIHFEFIFALQYKIGAISLTAAGINFLLYEMKGLDNISKSFSVIYSSIQLRDSHVSSFHFLSLLSFFLLL